jgi:formamidopyrimidine-DNA glycosylase
VPELPEVETVTRDLRPLLVGRAVVAVRRTSTHQLRRPWDEGWAGRLAGQTITAVRRRGKWIIVHLESAGCLVVHLGMTGQLVVTPAGAEQATHTHLVFDLDDGRQLRFRDPRRFGSARLFADQAGLDAFFVENGLGPEPFDLDPKAWRAALAGTQRTLKAVLLDQGVVAGVGNIYADEALFHARLHPARRGGDLTRAEADRLRKSVVVVLTTAIEHRGSTIRDYVGGNGQAGGYQDEFRVYGRTGQPCPRCATPIASVRLAGRSSHYCPRCQESGVRGQESGVSKKKKADS